MPLRALLSLLLISCNSSDKDDATGEADADTDADADADTDADADADTNADPVVYCAEADAVGRYAILEEGTHDAAPYIAGGVLTLSAGGTFSLDARQSLDGTVGDVATTAGTFAVDGETCRGSALSESGEAFFDFTIVAANDELRTIRTTAGSVVTGRAKAAADGCSGDTVAGEYGYGINAIVYLDIPGWPEGPSYFAGSGVVAVEPDGALSLEDRASIAGIVFNRSYTGSLEIGSDCTAAGEIVLPEGAVTSANPVYVEIAWADDQREASVIQTNDGTFIGGTAFRREEGITCDLSAVAGRYGFIQDGHEGDAPYVAGGLLEIGADGAVTLTGTQSLDGAVSSASPATGTLSFDEGCRGDVADAGGDAWLSITLVDADHFRLIRTDGGNVVTGFAKRMAEGCTAENIAGSYGYGINAVVYLDIAGWPEGPSPFAGAGAVDVAADGSLSLEDTASIAGIGVNRSYSGTVEVASDCTGSAVIDLPDEAVTSTDPVNVDIYWVDDRQEALLIQKDSGTFIAGAAVRRSVLP